LCSIFRGLCCVNKEEKSSISKILCFAGGFVEENESVELACIREAYEETNQS
jgi:ADP-ribose pyrophosphatase YjhB (NUDIX family)